MNPVTHAFQGHLQALEVVAEVSRQKFTSVFHDYDARLELLDK